MPIIGEYWHGTHKMPYKKKTSGFRSENLSPPTVAAHNLNGFQSNWNFKFFFIICTKAINGSFVIWCRISRPIDISFIVHTFGNANHICIRCSNIYIVFDRRVCACVCVCILLFTNINPHLSIVIIRFDQSVRSAKHIHTYKITGGRAFARIDKVASVDVSLHASLIPYIPKI